MAGLASDVAVVWGRPRATCLSWKQLMSLNIGDAETCLRPGRGSGQGKMSGANPCVWAL